ncbi:hypothetical protein V1511DRAFT_498203 [Dipodascopsis uninucleata]
MPKSRPVDNQAHASSTSDLLGSLGWKSSTADSGKSPVVQANKFVPKVWFITDCDTPIGRSVAVEALKKGHKVAAGCKTEAVGPLADLYNVYQNNLLILDLDTRNKPLCQSSLVILMRKWNRIDVLISCSLKTVIGAIEEVTEWQFREQLETVFYGPCNIISTVLPYMREQMTGHIICVTGISGAMGTPSLGLLSSATHALEGYCEALAFEVAPFNIKVTIVQPSLEATVLTAPILTAKQMEHYKHTVNAKVRTLFNSAEANSEYLVKDTTWAIMNIAGITNPPGRIVAGVDAIEQTKDKLRTVSEEMEDLLEISYSANTEPLSDSQKREIAGE